MDNASKALIMAGAILIAVALVSLGVYLYQSAASSVGDSTEYMDSAKVETQNAKFEQYAGNREKGPNVKNLIRAVGTFNANQVWPEKISIVITPKVGSASSGDTSNLANSIEDRKYYEVTMDEYDDTYGYLTKIGIKELWYFLVKGGYDRGHAIII